MTDEWKEREIEEKRDFAILTAEISKATFRMTPSEYKKFKNLPKQSKTNLRGHMNYLELILTMFGEKATTDLTKETDSQRFKECKKSAREGGSIAKRAREDLEKNLGRSVISKENFLPKKKESKKLK